MFKRKSLFEKEITLPLFEPEGEQQQNQQAQQNYNREEHSNYYKERQQNDENKKAAPPRIFENDMNAQGSSHSQNYAFRQEHHSEAQGNSSTMTLPREEPETTLGQGVTFNGKLEFQRMLRIDGHFEGELSSDGKLFVGPTGIVKSDINLNEAIIEGVLEGNITVKERLELRGEAQVHGNITAGILSVDEGVSIVGHVTVSPNESSSYSDSLEDSEKEEKETRIKKRKVRN